MAVFSADIVAVERGNTAWRKEHQKFAESREIYLKRASRLRGSRALWISKVKGSRHSEAMTLLVGSKLQSNNARNSLILN
jgi:hypothetical protein